MSLKKFPIPWSNKMNKWELLSTTGGPAKEKTCKDFLISRSEACWRQRKDHSTSAKPNCWNDLKMPSMLFICVYVHMLICTCVQVHVHMCVYLWRSEVDVYFFPQLRFIWFLRRSLSLNSELPESVRLIVQGAPRILLSRLPSPGVTMTNQYI